MPEDAQKTVQLVEPRPAVLSTVLFRVHEEQQLSRLRRTFLAMCSMAVLSGVGIFLVAQTIIESLSSSGFFRFLSLIVSDGVALVPYWQEYVYSLLEALPIVSLVVFVALFIIFLRSLQGVLSDVKRISHSVRIAHQ